ncbi:hypothetical protein Dimus_028708 [Dionaea muscipula]
MCSNQQAIKLSIAAHVNSLPSAQSNSRSGNWKLAYSPLIQHNVAEAAAAVQHEAISSSGPLMAQCSCTMQQQSSPIHELTAASSSAQQQPGSLQPSPTIAHCEVQQPIMQRQPSFNLANQEQLSADHHARDL